MTTRMTTRTILGAALIASLSACGLPSSTPIGAETQGAPALATYACGAGGEACAVNGLTVTAPAQAHAAR